MTPSDEAELMHMVATACQIDDRPSAIRYPRGEALGIEMPARGTPLAIGKGRVVREGSKVAILSLGTRLEDSLPRPATLPPRAPPTTSPAPRSPHPPTAAFLAAPPPSPRCWVRVRGGACAGC